MLMSEKKKGRWSIIITDILFNNIIFLMYMILNKICDIKRINFIDSYKHECRFLRILFYWYTEKNMWKKWIKYKHIIVSWVFKKKILETSTMCKKKQKLE